MNKNGKWLYLIFPIAILSLLLLILSSILIPSSKEEIFILKEVFTFIEQIILMGFSCNLIFYFLSLYWLFRFKKQPANKSNIRLLLIVLCIISIILIIGEKTMFDEIGREYDLEWEVTGEWIILYGFISTQLFYHILFLLYLRGLFLTSGQSSL
jgi:hypothetical protein